MASGYILPPLRARDKTILNIERGKRITAKLFTTLFCYMWPAISNFVLFKNFCIGIVCVGVRLYCFTYRMHRVFYT